MTVEGFRKLPEDTGPVYHELRHGELVSVTRPKYRHYTIQRRIRHLLEEFVPPGGLVDTEFAYRPLPEHELRVADVAYVCAEREQTINPEDNLHGAPDIAIEVLSPSNMAAELYDKEKLCLENGSREFWVVDMKYREVEVSTPDGHTVTFKSGQSIPLFFAPGAAISVDDLFQGRR